jgi:hypothetical protein
MAQRLWCSLFGAVSLFALCWWPELSYTEDLLQTEPASQNRPDQDLRNGRLLAAGNRWQLQFSPTTDLYPRIIADPRRSAFVLTKLIVTRPSLAGAGDSRLGLRLGGRYGFFRLHRTENPERGFQLDIEGGFIGQFDSDQENDNIGWDGIYGIQLAWAHSQNIAVRVGMFHDSSHVGDEYFESTGRSRINYTREELLAGVSWIFVKNWRFYAEGAYAFDLRNPALMKPWRMQYGFEYVSPPSMLGNRIGWYAALNISAFEENLWQQYPTLQIGLHFPATNLGRIYRCGIEYHDGRSQIGEFFQDEERYFSLGFWFDL